MKTDETHIFILLKRKKYSNFKKIVNKRGLKYVLENPYKHLKFTNDCYSKEYLRQLKYRLKKRYE